MSVLTRLVARAMGQAAPGLTPRLPGRFETGGGGGEPIEVDLRTVAALARVPEAARREAPPVRQTPRGHHAASETGERPASAQPSEAPAPEAPGPLAPRIAEPEPARAEPHDRPEPEELIVTALASHQPTAHPDVPPRPLALQAEHASEERRDATRERAPEVLLPDAPPPVERGRSPEPAGALSPPFRAAPVGRNRQAAGPEPPEITVHIGRIDVVMAPEERKGAKRPEPRRPQMTELGDYLRGRETGR